MNEEESEFVGPDNKLSSTESKLEGSEEELCLLTTVFHLEDQGTDGTIILK
jgi:hypothetical protein